MDVNVIDTREIDGVIHRVYLEQDQDCESPRGSDANAGVIVAPSSYYTWPMEDGDTIRAAEVAYALTTYSFTTVARWLRMFYGAITVLPLYSTGQEGRPSAGDESDTSPPGDYIGVTFDQPSTRKATGVPADQMAIALSVDVTEYSEWAIGECYGYVIERAEHDESDPIGVDISDHEGWEQVESCWGFIGAEYAEQEARRALSDL